jgi:hypothetical protein
MEVHQSRYFFGKTMLKEITVITSCSLLITSVHQLICFSYVVSFQILLDLLGVYGGTRLYPQLLLEQSPITRLPNCLLC